MICAGDTVEYATEFLQNTSQFTGEPAPCSWGPFARGIVSKIGDEHGDSRLITVQWENGDETRVLSCNLSRVVYV